MATKKPKQPAKAYDCTSGKPTNVGFAEVNLWTKVNRVQGEFPVYARAKFSEAYVEGKEASYRLFIRTAKVTLIADDLREAVARDNYEAVLKGARIAVSEKQTEKSGKGFGWSLSLKRKGAIGGDGSIGGSGSSNETASAEFRAGFDMTLVQPQANLTWQIGHAEHGDPRQMGSFLSGTYLMESGDPLCHFTITETGKPVTLKARLSVRRGDVHAVKDGQFWSDKEISRGQEPDMADAMQKRLVALKLMSSAQLSGVWVLASDAMTFTPARDDEA